MTMTAGGPASTIDPGDAPAILREMAATVRAVFGVGLQAARLADEPVAAVEAPPAPPVATAPPTSVSMPSVPMPSVPMPSVPMPSVPMPSVPMPTEPLVAPAAAAVAPVASMPASIPMPVSIPVPDLAPVAEAAESDESDEDAEADEAVTAELVEDEPPAPYVGEVPALRVVPDPPPTPTNDVPAEHSHAVLREVAFLDD